MSISGSLMCEHLTVKNTLYYIQYSSSNPVLEQKSVQKIAEYSQDMFFIKFNVFI